MTISTQAQIEAAKELWLKISCIEDRCVYIEKVSCGCFEAILSALTAAVEAGVQQSQWDKGYHAGFHAGQASIKAATIERCAQVAESLAFPYQVHVATGIEDMRAATRKEIAAAIRAMKG